MRQTVVERFWSKVDRTDYCWIWTGSTNGGRYGKIRDGGTIKSAHRFSWELEHGPIPAGMHIDHICHTPRCVRPDHMRLVTRKQNRENLNGAQRNNVSGHRGVTPNQAGNWMARVRHNKKMHYAGTFDNIEDAAEAARILRNQLFTHNDLDREAARCV
jgi:hypothetical protein